MKAYAHSKSFDAFKITKEQISGNYTSLQYLSTLDAFLWDALVPIHTECPSLFMNYIAKVVAQQSLKSSTKFSSDDRTKLPLHLFNMITAPTVQKSHIYARSMFLNRGLLFGFLALFHNLMRPYMALQSAFQPMDTIVRANKIHQLEQSVGLRSGGILYAAIQQSAFWYEKARWWKNMIMEKYTRMAINNARMTYKDFNHYVPLDDCVQIYVQVVSRAIDRCDARQGVLTSFIQNWFKSARSEVAKMAKGQTDHSYESITDDHGDSAQASLGVTDPDSSIELQQTLAEAARYVDPLGCVRASLGIPEYLTYADRESLLLFVAEFEELV